MGSTRIRYRAGPSPRELRAGVSTSPHAPVSDQEPYVFLLRAGVARRLLYGDPVRRVAPLVLVLLLSCKPASVAASNAACAADGDLVVVETRAHTLWLCSEHRAVARIRIALGRGGLDKAREGDGRTPLGTYALGAPKTSSRFRTFIPIGYPTAEQHARSEERRVGKECRSRWAPD